VRPEYIAFAYLQLLDVLTTLLGVRAGCEEISPFVRRLMDLDPLAGLGVSKIVAFVLAGTCILLRRQRVIGWINCWYAALVVWNLGVLLIVQGG
jgi:hypothetical protein